MWPKGGGGRPHLTNSIKDGRGPGKSLIETNSKVRVLLGPWAGIVVNGKEGSGNGLKSIKEDALGFSWVNCKLPVIEEIND